MIDAHCHVTGGDPSVREWLIGRDFYGMHPWETLAMSRAVSVEALAQALRENPHAGVGEIGLDRLRERTIPMVMREMFETQLECAAAFGRPVVLHGAKCWGEVVRACRPYAKRIPAFLFHGFSRSDGLIPDIVDLNGFISIGPAILNDHAVNYRELAKKIPSDRLLVETDRTVENAVECPSVIEIAEKLAELRGLPFAGLDALVEVNAERLRSSLVPRQKV